MKENSRKNFPKIFFLRIFLGKISWKNFYEKRFRGKISWTKNFIEEKYVRILLYFEKMSLSNMSCIKCNSCFDRCNVYGKDLLCSFVPSELFNYHFKWNEMIIIFQQKFISFLPKFPQLLVWGICLKYITEMQIFGRSCSPGKEPKLNHISIIKSEWLDIFNNFKNLYNLHITHTYMIYINNGFSLIFSDSVRTYYWIQTIIIGYAFLFLILSQFIRIGY